MSDVMLWVWLSGVGFGVALVCGTVVIYNWWRGSVSPRRN